MKNYRLTSWLLLCSLFLLVGCTFYIRPETALTPAPDAAADADIGPVVHGVAMVDAIEIRMLEAPPIAVQVVARGNLTDSCTEIDEAIVEQEGDTYQVNLTTRRPADALCAQVVTPFEEIIPLNVDGKPAGAYLVDVNGVTDSFTLPAASVSPGATPVPAEEALRLTTLAQQALAEQLNIDTAAIAIDSVEPLPDSAGYSIRLRAVGNVYEYHGRNGEVVLVADPLPPALFVEIESYDALIDALRGVGATVDLTGTVDAATEPIFTVPGRLLTVNGEEVQVYVYPDIADAQTEAARVSPDGAEISPAAGEQGDAMTVDWGATPYFYRQGPVIVLYVGEDAETVQLLEQVLGPPFAAG